MHDRPAASANRDRPNGGAIQPSAAGDGPVLTNPVGWDFVMREIAERNPIVRQALVRRAEGWSG